MSNKDFKHLNSSGLSKRASKGKAQISANAGYLRIQLPRELFGGKQKYLALGLSDTPENRCEAQAKLTIIQRDIDYEEFDVTFQKYKSKELDSSVIQKQDDLMSALTVGEYFKIYQEEFFPTKGRRQTKRQQIAMFKSHEGRIKKYLPFDSILTKDLITEGFKNTPPSSAVRANLWDALVSFCRVIGFEYDKFDKFKCTYEYKSRDIPDDQAIIDGWAKMKVPPQRQDVRFLGNEDCYNWAYGILATYGLRPHEILAIDCQKSFKPPRYALYIDSTITDGTKTGNRVVYPLPPDWVEFFDLSNVKNTLFIDNINRNINFLPEMSNYLSRRFRTREVGFQPYDLRHRYAIRGHELGVPIDDMSRWMGHNIQTHTRTYQKWMKEETSQIIFDLMLERIEDNKRKENGMLTYQELEFEVKKAKLRIIELETK
jgi:hypothetical protein